MSRMELAIIDPKTSEKREIAKFRIMLKTLFVSIVERACDVIASVDELDTHERARLERLFESLERAEKIRRN